MLLPFAGFLYGSVLHIQTLNQNPHTAWLTHFVFPVLTLGWIGPILVATGLVLFIIGASQIYWAKFRRTGLQTRGIYRFVRHPQYIALTLFGVGILLTWGRAITFLAFFAMMLLYYYLAKSEERRCIRVFGDAYERYREHTSFIIPGDKWLRQWRPEQLSVKLPTPLRVVGACILTLLLCLGLMHLIQTIKLGSQTVPYLSAAVPLTAARGAAAEIAMTSGETNGIPFVQAGRVAVIRGPYRNAFASGFAERVLLRLRESRTLASFLAFLHEPGEDVAIVWCAPYERPEGPTGPGTQSGVRGPAPDPHGPDRVRVILMRCSLAPGATVADALADKSKRTVVKGCVAQVNVGRPEGEDFVEADGKTRGPGFPGESRWDFFLEQFSLRNKEAGQGTVGSIMIPGRFPEAEIVLVQAPILRTRIDTAFAQDILKRLVASETFRGRIGKSGAGGPVVAVAFPRPGPNWYSEHHGTPQISLFVMLAQLTNEADTTLDDLFHRNGRRLLSAFTAAMDFKVAPPEDSVDDITTIGPLRDLEERWRFFVSGVGAGSMRHEHAMD